MNRTSPPDPDAAWLALNGELTACERCPRLRAHCEAVARTRRKAFADQQYWGRPVPNFGDPRGRLLIVGLAPAAHGANRTGRMFTGDRSGDWLYRALYRAGFANQETAEHAADGLHLRDCAITAVCHCAPPDNKPTRDERLHCQGWLEQTFSLLPVKVILALGSLAWNAASDEATRRGWRSGGRAKFAHAAREPLADGRTLLGSYHPSQQNTFTGRLTEAMLDRVLADAQSLLDSPPRK